MNATFRLYRLDKYNDLLRTHCGFIKEYIYKIPSTPGPSLVTLLVIVHWSLVIMVVYKGRLGRVSYNDVRKCRFTEMQKCRNAKTYGKCDPIL